jgi:hypothetical protein
LRKVGAKVGNRWGRGGQPLAQACHMCARVFTAPPGAGRRAPGKEAKEAKRKAKRKGRELPVDARGEDARFTLVDVVLRKLGRGARAVGGRLVRAPRKGSVVVIEFPDGMHEYVTTPVKRVLRIAGREIFYIETINSRYRLEVRSREPAAAEGTG